MNPLTAAAAGAAALPTSRWVVLSCQDPAGNARWFGRINDGIDIIHAISALRQAMTAITIRNLDDTLKARLRLQAARHGHSMEEEARQLLHKGLEPDPGIGPVRLTALAQSLFSAEHGVDLVLPPRDAARTLPGWPE